MGSVCGPAFSSRLLAALVHGVEEAEAGNRVRMGGDMTETALWETDFSESAQLYFKE